MRLNTSIQIPTMTVGKHQDRILIFLGDTEGSLMLSQGEAVDLHQKIGAILPSRALPAIDRLLRAIRDERSARNRYIAALDDCERQMASDGLRNAVFELDQAISAAEIVALKVAA